MKETRSEQVNRALAARRALMRRRIRIGRILLILWLLFAALNLALLYGSRNLRLPVSCTTADLLMMFYFLSPNAAGSGLLVPLSLLIPALLLPAIVFWKSEKGEFWRRGVFLLLWLDVVCMLSAYLWNPAILFGENQFQLALAVGNLASHVFLIWWISRARRAVQSLEILPETEAEGDPFEEFKRDQESL